MKSILNSRLKMGVILIAVSAAVIAYSYFTQSAWLSGLLQNFGAGIVTSLLLIVLYDRIIEKRAEAELKARRLIAMRRLSYALQGHVQSVLFSMYRSSVESRPVDGVGSYREFVRSHFAGPIANLNIMAPSDAGYPTTPSYADWIAQSFKVFMEMLRGWITTYATCSSNDSIGLAESMLASPFLVWGTQLDRMMVAMGSANFRPSALNFGTPAMTSEYAQLLERLIAEVEATTGESIGEFNDSAWHNEFYPVGHARMQIQVPPVFQATPAGR
ncbi:hypothetical protein [Paraburkholderia bannensis]|uniref:hypothetical protein n=1 Tax=Paraburkholderia bannensis TaxID=765414 RepID=UPI002AB765B8|nr:hypothetical protein [Paraburkholderia bannensis]